MMLVFIHIHIYIHILKAPTFSFLGNDLKKKALKNHFNRYYIININITTNITQL